MLNIHQDCKKENPARAPPAPPHLRSRQYRLLPCLHTTERGVKEDRAVGDSLHLHHFYCTLSNRQHRSMSSSPKPFWGFFLTKQHYFKPLAQITNSLTTHSFHSPVGRTQDNQRRRHKSGYLITFKQLYFPLSCTGNCFFCKGCKSLN